MNIIIFWILCGITAFIIDVIITKEKLNKSEHLLNMLQTLFLGPLGLILFLYFKIKCEKSETNGSTR